MKKERIIERNETQLNEISTWKPTMELRWRKFLLWEHQETGEVKVLEQKWVSNSGREKWEEIPTV